MEQKKIKILFLCKGSNDCGNFITISRISKNIKLINDHVETKISPIINLVEIERQFIETLTQWTPDIIVGLNLSRCSFLANQEMPIDTPIIMILGGTDINAKMNESTDQQLLGLLKKCRRIIAFSPEMKNIFQNRFSQILHNMNLQIDIIPQGIDIIDIEMYLHNSENDQILKSFNIKNFFVIIGRLRSVKDPIFIVKPFIEWIASFGRNNFSLLYVGNIEEETEDIINFLEEIKRQPNIYHINSLPQTRVFNLMIKSKALINCSKNEGQNTTMLEAMSIGVPIIARKVAGNIGLIKDNYNGLFFDEEKGFKESLSKVINPEFAKTLTENAKKYVFGHHNSQTEAIQYIDIFNGVK